MARYVTYLCGGDYRPGPRDTCPDPVHDWPEPSGYVDSFEVASSRANRGWVSVRCPSGCGIYGWRPGRIDPTMDHRVPHITTFDGGDPDSGHDKTTADSEATEGGQGHGPHR